LKENSSFKIFVQEKLGAKKVYAKDSEIENLEVNILIQNFKKKTKRRKKFRTKINTGKLEKKRRWKSEARNRSTYGAWHCGPSLGP